MEAAVETIPDGTYSDRLIQEVSRNGDRGTYPVQTTVRKVGKELIWDNVGTHDQVGAINVGFAAWRGAILGSITVLMLPGQRGCIGGAARLCKFEPEPGTITAPDWGAAVSPAGVYATETAISLGNALVSKMMLASSDDTLRAHAVPPPSSPVRTSAATTTSAGWATTCSAAAVAPPGATANSPTATSGSPRGAARTSRPTRPTGRSSTSSAASTPTPAGRAARAPA